MPSATIDAIRRRLEATLAPSELTIEDESAQHAGHAGARAGGGHYRIRLVSPAFGGLSRVARHRLVYDCLAEMMQHEIHALAVQARAPDE